MFITYYKVSSLLSGLVCFWEHGCQTKLWHVVYFLLGDYPTSEFRCRGITQKKAYNIQDTAKVWNQENFDIQIDIHFRRSSSSGWLKFIWFWMKKFLEFCHFNSCLFCPIVLMLIGKSIFESGEEGVNITWQWACQLEN